MLGCKDRHSEVEYFLNGSLLHPLVSLLLLNRTGFLIQMKIVIRNNLILKLVTTIKKMKKNIPLRLTLSGRPRETPHDSQIL